MLFRSWKGVTAETLIDMIDPNGQPKRVPANQVHDMIQQGWTGPQVPSEIGGVELGRPKAPPPNMPTKVESGHGTPQARELGAQTRVPGGQFEPSPLTFGGRTAEPGVPFTTAAGERLGGPVVGSYDTIKVRYPDMPTPKLGGKYPVQFPDGSTKTFSNASAAKTARELVARWTQEFGK